ncbi:MAG: hypothetical protein FJY95_01330 [Candidatus Handelsmanbacteria bacterium]|nr:hypothetical protein [Candidatus Handelsmanbacteria bacterium]
MGWWALLWLAGALPALAAPAAEARLDTAQVRVGDPLHLELRLRYPQGARPLLPPVPALLGDFTVRPEAPLPPVAEGGEVAEVHRYELRIYRPGTHRLPSLEIALVQTGGDTLKLATAPLTVEVLRVRPEGDKELRDIKGPVDLGSGLPAWAWGLIGALAALAAAGGLYWWLRRRQRPAIPPPPPPPKDYLAEFSRIAGMGLLEVGGTKVYYSLLAETLRRFLEDRMGIEAMERTTVEIAASLRASGCEAGLATQIESFLGAADLVKFARFTPGPEEARQAPEEGKAIVRRGLTLAAEAEAARRAQESAPASAC